MRAFCQEYVLTSEDVPEIPEKKPPKRQAFYRSMVARLQCKGPTNVSGLDGYFDADWGTSDSRRSTTSSYPIETRAPEISGTLHRGGRILSGIARSGSGHPSSSAAKRHGIRARIADASAWGQHRSHGVCRLCRADLLTMGCRQRARRRDVRKHFAHEAALSARASSSPPTVRSRSARRCVCQV